MQYVLDSKTVADVGAQNALILEVVRMNDSGGGVTRKTVNKALPFLTERQIWHSLNSLEERGYLNGTQPRKGHGDVTKLYSVK
jgi:hypothetical protein